MKGRDPEPKKGAGAPSDQWRYLFVYVIALLLIVWFWQEAISRVSVKTIAYSQFKEHLGRGEVIEVNVSPEVVHGKIRPQPANQAPAKAQPKDIVFRAVRVED